MYGSDASAALIPKFTDRALDSVIDRQNRALGAVYPNIYLDCIVLKIRQKNQVINKSIYLALGINMGGHKELLGMWPTEYEGAKFWLSVLTELKSLGLEDVLINCMNELKGFPEAIATEYPQIKVHLCIVYIAEVRFLEELQGRHGGLKGVWL